ncbi:uncharacterized protein mtTFB2 isoform X2 [Lepeophtheirus salmonis]|uniref:uncharacterized protein mtTFB2 isoform X2 n=1 Tax=Lepeophtheirus salmonis TaxID=72036 RepID=UPI001AE93308|nr:uncharacterized protein LOC121121080 isoform X2 [Lepeophtheirus salmonis]
MITRCRHKSKQSHVFKMLGLFWGIGRQRFYHSGELSRMRTYAESVNPKMAAFIQEKNLWEVIISYVKKQYSIEKSVLFDPNVGLVSSSMHGLKKYQRIFAAEERLIDALKWTAKDLEGPDGLVVIKKNLSNDKSLVNFLKTKHIILEDRNWELDYTQITIFGIMSHNCIKRLTYSLKQYHVALTKNDVVTNLYNFGRPEFFFLISHRTLAHITSKPGQYMMRNTSNVLSQLLFEIEVVSTYPREAFLPWKNHFNKKTPTYEKLFPELESQFYLIRLTPRDKLYNIESPSNISYFPFFLRAILGKRRHKVYELIETFIPNISDFLQEHSGICYNKITGLLTNDEIVKLFNLIVQHPNFHGSTFRGAALHYEEESTNMDFTPRVMTDVYDAQRKTLLTSGSLKWDNNSSEELK